MSITPWVVPVPVSGMITSKLAGAGPPVAARAGSAESALLS